MIKSVEQWISKVTLLLGSVVLMLMMGQIVVDVFMRSVFSAGFPATAELVAKYYMVAVSFVPVAYAEVKRRHVEATIFTDLLAKRKKQLVVCAGFLLSIFVYSLLLWGTFFDALEQTEKGAYVESGIDIFYTWPSYWILPVSFGVMLLLCILRFLSLLSAILHGEYLDLDEDGNEAIAVNLDHAGEQ